MDPVAMDTDRPMWHSAKAFILASTGAGVGFGSFFRLPYMFHRFGVGTFFTAYCITLILIAWPLTVMEMFLGQNFRKGSIDALKLVNPKLVGVGYATILFCSFPISIYFAVVLSWTISSYLIPSFRKDVPYDYRTEIQLENYFFENALYTDAHNNYWVFLALIGLWVIVFILVLRGVRSVSWMAYVVVPVPILFAIGLMIYAQTLDNGGSSLSTAMKPVFSDFKKLDLWANAIGQSFLTLQCATGVMIAFGSYAKPVHNCFNICLGLITLGIFLTLNFALLVSAVEGHIRGEAEAKRMQVNAMKQSGLFAPFLVYPMLLGQMGQWWAVVFFLCVLLLGLQQLAATVHSVFTVVRDRFLFKGESLLIGLVCIVCTCCSLPLCLRGGYEFLVAIDEAVVGVTLPLVAFVECLGIGYMWADRSILDVVNERAVSGCTKVKAFFVVAYNHSVGRMQELLSAQGQKFWGRGALPFLIKFLIPISCVITALANGIISFLISERYGAAETAIGLAIPGISLLVIFLSACATNPREPESITPWKESDTIAATQLPPSSTSIGASATILKPRERGNEQPLEDGIEMKEMVFSPTSQDQPDQLTVLALGSNPPQHSNGGGGVLRSGSQNLLASFAAPQVGNNPNKPENHYHHQHLDPNADSIYSPQLNLKVQTPTDPNRYHPKSIYKSGATSSIRPPPLEAEQQPKGPTGNVTIGVASSPSTVAAPATTTQRITRTDSGLIAFGTTTVSQNANSKGSSLSMTPPISGRASLEGTLHSDNEGSKSGMKDR